MSRSALVTVPSLCALALLALAHRMGEAEPEARLTRPAVRAVLPMRVAGAPAVRIERKPEPAPDARLRPSPARISRPAQAVEQAPDPIWREAVLELTDGPGDLLEQAAYVRSHRQPPAAGRIEGVMLWDRPYELRLWREGRVVLRVLWRGDRFTLWPAPGRYTLEVRMGRDLRGTPVPVSVMPGRVVRVELTP